MTIVNVEAQDLGRGDFVKIDSATGMPSNGKWRPVESAVRFPMLTEQGAQDVMHVRGFGWMANWALDKKVEVQLGPDKRKRRRHRFRSR